MSTNFLSSKVCRPVMFWLYTSSKLSSPSFEFSLKVMGLNPGSLLRSFSTLCHQILKCIVLWKKNELKKKLPNCSTNLADTKLSELFGAHILKVACILQKMSLYNAIRLLFQIQSGLVYPAHNIELVINAQCQRWRDINQSIFAVGSTQPQCGKSNSEVI